MAQVEQHATTGLSLVFVDDARLQQNRHAYCANRRVGVARNQGLGIPLEHLDGLLAVEPRTLHDLGEAGNSLFTRQRRQRVDVAEHELGLVEGADEVLAARPVEAGLSTHRAVDHR